MATPDVTERPTSIALGNPLVFRVYGVRTRGPSGPEIDESLTLRAYVGEDETATDPLHPALVCDLEAIGDGSGDYQGEIAGNVVSPVLEPRLWDEVALIAESVPAGDYRSAFTVTVTPAQP